MNLNQMLQQTGVITSMARELDSDEQTARTGASALLPAIVAGMGRRTTGSQSQGLGGLADVLGGALGGRGSSAGGLGGALGGGLGGVLLESVLGSGPTKTNAGNDILGEIFGSKDVSRGVAEEVAGTTGISSDVLKRMLPIIAMAVVGYMMNRGQSDAAPSGGAGSMGGGALGGALGGLLTQVVAGMGRR